MNTVLITGVDGFTGGYLAARLGKAGYEVHGLVRHALPETIAGVNRLHVCDLSDIAGLTQVLGQVAPEKLVHLAAISFVAHDSIEDLYRTNVIGTRNLLAAAVAAEAPLNAVLVASSANIYGNSDRDVIEEDTLLAPANDYAVTKLAMEYVARLYYTRLPIVLVRPFNYTGVGQAEHFLIPKIVSHVRRGASVIELGNTNVARDFSDVRGVVDAYHRLIENPKAVGDIFNICSGQAHTLGDVMDIVRTLSGRDLQIRINPAFVRSNEVKRLCGSRAKFDKLIGGATMPSLTETLRWMLEA